MLQEKSQETTYFTSFQASIAAYPLPDKFTFPFYYEAHPLCLLAAKELQDYLKTQTDWEHNFGLEEGQEGLVIGKMFGVLVVQKKSGEVGYLAAFSGKLAGTNTHQRFVPPLFDMLIDGSFFLEEEQILNGYNRRVEALETAPAYLACQAAYAEEKELIERTLAAAKRIAKAAKKDRKTRRQAGEQELVPSSFEDLKEELRLESIKSNYFLKKAKKELIEREKANAERLAHFTNSIQELKQERKAISAALQQKLFDQYQFLNQQGELKSLCAIFEPTVQKTPPAGAGECAAPKLLQYAFAHDLKPIAMAEFWWGQSPNAEIRKHGQFYPACRGKCEPILGHMLAGIEMDKNPMLTNTAIGKVLEIIYEDDCMLVVNKPTEFLSVPGRVIQDSVALRMKQRFPTATGPMVVHRLDMSTSGIMLVAKSMEVHQYLQRQFIKRSIKKRYIALLDGIVEADEGLIDLPLHVDWHNRPQQMVCYEFGKPAQTKWKVLERKNGRTTVHFFPITGRTHQLRVHAAHPKGLNIPIVGDDLYGLKADRLYLHAEWIEFKHPKTKTIMTIQLDSPDIIVKG